MKKKIGLLLATLMVLNTAISSTAYGWSNPLKDYNLYADTHPSDNDESAMERDNVMSDYYSNSLAGQNTPSVPSDIPSYGNGEPSQEVEVPQRRNDYLRESSRKVYSTGQPGWLSEPSFYSNPTLASIKTKYHKSNFAGCLQECISYVKLHPSDTLGYYYLAMCYAKVSDKENAIRAYEKVIALNDNPMIVKYATNGRNCVMGSDDAKCYQDVNVPELIYPYADVAESVADLTPIDPQTLVNRNLSQLRSKLSPMEKKDENNNDPNAKDKDKKKINLPFGQQDDKLDAFINAPYGNGLSPDLNKQYQQLQLKKIQQNLNNEQSTTDDSNVMKNIHNFDNHKTDSGEIKLAYATQNEMESYTKSSEYLQSQKELEELRVLFGNDNSSKSSDDEMMNMLMTGNGKNLSPEVIQAMMQKSMMTDFTL